MGRIRTLAFILVNRHQCPSFKGFPVVRKHAYYDRGQMIGRYVLSANLADAGRACPRMGEEHSEIEIVSEHDSIIFSRPLHEFRIGRRRSAKG